MMKKKTRGEGVVEAKAVAVSAVAVSAVAAVLRRIAGVRSSEVASSPVQCILVRMSQPEY